MADKTVKVKTSVPFGVIISQGAREYLKPTLYNSKKVLIVSDDNVCKIYGHQIKKVIDRDDLEIYTFIYPSSENGKSKYILDKLLILMTEINLSKSDCVIALGGKGAMSLTGFACAIFKGGVTHINLPTTITGMCGDCISGKTGSDFLGREDLLSAIYYPKAVFCDTDLTKTLKEEQFLYGLMEIVRCAVAVDKKAFVKMEESAFSLEDGIYSTLKIKSGIETKAFGYKEKAKKIKLGEIFAKSARYVSHYTVTEGDALAAGVLIATEIAEKLGISTGIYDRIVSVYNKLGITWDISIKKDRIIEYIANDLKAKNKEIEIVVPVDIGKCVSVNFTFNKLKEIWFGY